MKRSFSFALAGALALLLAACGQTVAPEAGAELAPAAVIETISQTSAISFTGEDLFAQTFTPTVSGFLTKITIYHSGPGFGTPRISFYAGAGPTTVPLRIQPVAWTVIGPQQVTLDDPLPVAAGQTYTYYPEGAYLRLDASANSTDLYPGGEAWIDEPPGWQPYSVWLPTINPGATANVDSDLAFVIVIDDHDPTSCLAGTYSDGDACVPAPLGTYVAEAGATSATPCPAGTFSDQLGAVACTPAPAGSFVATIGAAQATLCPAGSFSDLTGAVACTPAPIGFYVPGPGATQAIACPAGETTEFVGAVACVAVNAPPTADPNGPYLVAADESVALDSSGSSDPDGDPLTPTWSTSEGSLAGETYVAGSTPGINDVCLTVDDGIAVSPEVCTYVVVYDPSAGFVTGGGWIESPAGAFVADEDLGGKANFGFVAKYKKGRSIPDGNTLFAFSAGDLNFRSSSYDWLVVNQNDGNAQFKGDGSVNGAPGYGFMLWAGDDDPDTFRIKIWDGDDVVVYDNGGTPLGGGSIVVHRGR